MPRTIIKRNASLLGCLLFSIAVSANAAAAKSTTFERDLESLFGAGLATKHGEISIRQRKDSQGRVRKQIFVGPSFSEIQLDQNADGTVDFWEITRGEKTVLATNPSRGRFLRMNVTERSKEGTFEAFYVLDLDGRRYNLLRTKFDRADRRLMSESVPASFAAEEIPDAPVVSSSANSTQLPKDERFDLEDQSWREFQSRIWGPDLLCVSDDSSSGRLATLQREWWKILKRDTDGRVDRLTDKLKDSKMFDSSCRKPGREKDFDQIAKSLSELMMTSSKGEASTDTQSRGRYLRCLENSGLGITAARIEQNFLSGMNDPYRAENPIRCDFKPGANTGYANPNIRQVVLHMCLPDEGKTKTADGSPYNYKNLLFHELTHVAGVESEEMTQAAQGCCGDPIASASRVAACVKLDKLVAEERRFTELEAFLARDGSMAPLLNELTAKFDVNGTADIYRKFLLGLDSYKRGTPPSGVFELGLINNEEFSKCVNVSSETKCRDEWIRHLESYADSFFKNECKKIVIGASKSECKKVTADFKSRLVNTIARSMIHLSSDRDPGDPQICKSPVPASDLKSRAAKFFSRMIAPSYAVEDVPCDDGIVAPPPPPDVQLPPSTIPGEVPPAAQAPPLDTIGAKRPGVGVPGDSDIGTVVSRPGGDSSVGSSTGSRPPNPSYPIGVPDRSPLPVTRVTSPDSGRSVAERNYQRATDFAGLTTRGLRDLRDSIVPRAVAADRSRSKSNRLDGDESFIAFRPTKSDGKAFKVDNPFAAKRGVASLVLPKNDSALLSKSSLLTSGGGGDPASVPGAAPSDSGAFSGTTSGSSPSGQSALKGSSGQRVNGDSIQASKATAKNTAPDAPGSLAPTSKSLSDREPAEVLALLDGLFTRKYRLIESRLNNLKLQQNLIDRGIKIIGADGRLIGAKKTVRTCYKYVGQELPLKTPCEN
ncbi:MAG: hypothetical protein J0L82_01355 [Deltaproteobacteria bacterium]|nr:hypothetical protein [Deltaproteobacteria bacterium]